MMMKILSLFLILTLMVTMSGCIGIIGDASPNETSNQESQEPVQSEGDTQLAQQISYEIFPLKNNEYLFMLTNQGETDISELILRARFFDENGNEVAKREYYFKAFGAKLINYEFSSDLKDFEIDMEQTKVYFEHGKSGFDYINAIDNVEFENEGYENSTLMPTITNTGVNTLEFVKLHTIFYHNSEIVGAVSRTRSNLNSGDDEEIEFLVPYDSELKIIQYDNFEIFVTTAYYKG